MHGSATNFGFLQTREPQLYRFGSLAERYFVDDPNTSHIKLRQFSELLCQLTAARFGIETTVGETQADLLRRLGFDRALPREVGDLFHALRVSGNRAAHEHAGDHASALTSLKLARQLAIWFVRTFYEPSLPAGPFMPPKEPEDASAGLLAELSKLRAEVESARSESEALRQASTVAEQARLTASELAERERLDRETWEELAQEAEAAKADLAAQLQAALKASQSDDAPDPEIVVELARDAANQINLDESATRALIDQQMRDAGWEADTKALRYANGARPIKGRNRAIAEWPTMTGPADYALFCSLTLVATVEAKRRNRNVMEVLRQAERYASDIHMQESHFADDGPWNEFKAPFAFSTNGRPYLKQVAALSGIWRRDLRDADNPAEVISGWPTPRGLIERLAVDKRAATKTLAAEPFDFGFPIRLYHEDGTPRYVPISEHDDEVTSVTRGYGEGTSRPEDFLDAFTRFVRENVNRIAALNIVVQRPQDLTREELRQLRLELDAAGFTDSKIRRAWVDAKNEDIAASIIGYIRQAAIGDPLTPYAERVRTAVAAIQAQQAWTEVQRNWIRRIGDQIALELVVDRAAFDSEPFAGLGGWNRIDKMFNGELSGVIRDLNDNIWKRAG